MPHPGAAPGPAEELQLAGTLHKRSHRSGMYQKVKVHLGWG